MFADFRKHVAIRASGATRKQTDQRVTSATDFGRFIENRADSFCNSEKPRSKRQ